MNLFGIGEDAGHAAVDDELGSGDEFGRIGAEVDSGIGDVARFADSTCRVSFVVYRADWCIAVGDVAGGYGVDPNPISGPQLDG